MPIRQFRPFHIAVQVRDLAEARAFYGGVLGCPEGRNSQHWVDFDLFGHQFVCHLNPGLGPDGRVHGYPAEVDGTAVPIPHFGVAMQMDEWDALVERLRSRRVKYLVEPHVRFRGECGEQGTLFITDPSGNALEFKGFRDLGRLFAAGEADSQPASARPPAT